MFEILILLLFALSLVFCVIKGFAIINALVFGFVLFLAYGRIKGHSFKSLLKMCITGIKQMKNILLVFMLIGMITALWKASGTIAYIISKGSNFITPDLFILVTFILCSLLSILIGTSFGTAATMGVICISMARAMGINELITGGAIISGIFYGDRCSPMSTSALLVSEITGTNIFNNIKYMFRTGMVPTIITCLIYYLLGRGNLSGDVDFEIINAIRGNFNLNPLLIMPATIIIALSLFRVNVKKTMLISIITAGLLAYIYQGESMADILTYGLLGYRSDNYQIDKLFHGGGIVSMINVSIIIIISATYSGIFEGTGLLIKIKDKIKNLADRTGSFFATFVVGIITNLIACNQSLATILTYQLCKGIDDDQTLAIHIENTTIVMASLVPWSIALAVPLSTLNLDYRVLPYICYAYILPVYTLLMQILRPGLDKYKIKW